MISDALYKEILSMHLLRLKACIYREHSMVICGTTKPIGNSFFIHFPNVKNIRRPNNVALNSRTKLNGGKVALCFVLSHEVML